MKDRQPGKPGQYKAKLSTAEFKKMQAGQEFTITIVRDDQPIVVGTPYSKAAVLPDALAVLICPNIDDPTPADALSALQNNKAPAGFGLGTTCTFVSSPDLATACGFYMAPAPSQIASAGNMRGVVLTSSASYLTQIWSVNGSLIKRELANGVFGQYEWINPPMKPGVEYCTVERWNNKAVYAKRISCGAAADMKSIEHNLNATSIIRFSGTIRDMPMPFEFDETLYARVAVHPNTIYLLEHGFDNADVQVTLWYIKD